MAQQPYDPVGALGGLFAPAYIAGNPESEQAVSAWNTAHTATPPPSDFAPGSTSTAAITASNPVQPFAGYDPYTGPQSRWAAVGLPPPSGAAMPQRDAITSALMQRGG